MKNNLTLILLGVFFVCVPELAQSAIVTKTFTGTVMDGSYTGMIGTGSFSYDEDLIVSADVRITPINGLEVIFNFDGQTFNETNDFDFYDDEFPELRVVEFVPTNLSYVLVNGYNGVDFNLPGLDALEIYRGLMPSNNGVFDFEAKIYVDTVPIPGALWLLGTGLISIAGYRRRYKI